MPFGRWGGEAVGASGGDSNQQSVELDGGRVFFNTTQFPQEANFEENRGKFELISIHQKSDMWGNTGRSYEGL